MSWYTDGVNPMLPANTRIAPLGNIMPPSKCKLETQSEKQFLSARLALLLAFLSCHTAQHASRKAEMVLRHRATSFEQQCQRFMRFRVETRPIRQPFSRQRVSMSKCSAILRNKKLTPRKTKFLLFGF